MSRPQTPSHLVCTLLRLRQQITCRPEAHQFLTPTFTGCNHSRQPSMGTWHTFRPLFTICHGFTHGLIATAFQSHQQSRLCWIRRHGSCRCAPHTITGLFTALQQGRGPPERLVEPMSPVLRHQRLAACHCELPCHRSCMRPGLHRGRRA